MRTYYIENSTFDIDYRFLEFPRTRYQEQRSGVRFGVGRIFEEFQYRFEARDYHPYNTFGLRSFANQSRAQGNVGTPVEIDSAGQGYG